MDSSMRDGVGTAPKICSSLPWTEKGPSRLTGRGKFSRAGQVISSALPTLHSVGPNASLVAQDPVRDLFVSAKDLFVEAMASTGPGTKTVDLDQNFEPVRTTGDQRAEGRLSEMPERIMSDEFDRRTGARRLKDGFDEFTTNER